MVIVLCKVFALLGCVFGFVRFGVYCGVCFGSSGG